MWLRAWICVAASSGDRTRFVLSLHLETSFALPAPVSYQPDVAVQGRVVAVINECPSFAALSYVRHYLFALARTAIAHLIRHEKAGLN